MDEDKEINATENPRDRIQSKTVETLDRADQIAERQKRENDRRQELLEREEALAARKAVGGETEAGTETIPELTEEEIASKKRIKDVGMATNAKWAQDMKIEDGKNI